MRTLAQALVLSGALLGGERADAQFIARTTMIPIETSARRIAPDIALPSAAQAARIAALEATARIDQPCNTTSAPEFEAPRRALLALYEASYGPEHPATARPLLALLCTLNYNARTPSAQAERTALVDRLVAIGRARGQPAILYAGLDARIGQMVVAGRAAAAVGDAREALAIARRQFAADPLILAVSAERLAACLEAGGEVTEAEPLRNEAVMRLQTLRDGDPFRLGQAYEGLAGNLVRQFRVKDADAWYARTFDLYEGLVGGADRERLSMVMTATQNLAGADPARAEALYRVILARQEALPGSSDKANWMTLWNLGKSAFLRHDTDGAIAFQRRVIAAMGDGPGGSFAGELARMLALRRETAAEAETLYRRLLAASPDDPGLMESLGNTLWTLDRFDEALPMRRRAVELAALRYGPHHRETLRLTQNFAVALWIRGRPLEARPYYEAVLGGYRAELSAIPDGGNADYRRNLGDFVGQKAIELLKLYWTDRGAPGGRADREAQARGFAVAQLAHPSITAGAVNETAARLLAARAGKEALFTAWSAARDQVTMLDAGILAAAQAGAARDGERVALLARRAEAGAALEAAASAFRQALPGVFATLRPEPVSLAAVSGRDGGSGLLRADEALFLLFPGMPQAGAPMSRGLVFAVTREGAAWAEIPLDGIDLANAVATLHDQLATRDMSGATALGPQDDPADFVRYDRAAAYRVYQALFGDPAIARLAGGKARWTLVPEGPLLGLDFAALVSAPPAGGAAGDISPEALRATRWLGFDHVLAVSPSVDALRLARAGGAGARGESAGATGFVGIGDPALRGVADPPGLPLPAMTPAAGEARRAGGQARAASRGGGAPGARQRYYRDGVADPAMIASLPRLAYSAAEVERMAGLLHAAPDRVLLQMKANQPEVERRSADGTLRESGVILFATHALVGGQADGSSSEPALALTPGPDALKGHPQAGDDGLLTASEIAPLKLDGALVILSACDTAAGGASGDGFSGLTRAFLLAGARSVMATYAPVVDEVGARLTTATVSRWKDNGADMARALQGAMREIMADTAHDASGGAFSHPSVWAPYVAVDPF